MRIRADKLAPAATHCTEIPVATHLTADLWVVPLASGLMTTYL